LPEVFVLGDGRETRDWAPFQDRVYNNSPITNVCRVKLVSWGFNRKKENLTTSSSSFQISLLAKQPATPSQDTLYNLLLIFGIIILIFLIVIFVIIFILKYHRTKKKSLTPPPECVPFDLTPKVLTMEMQMPVIPPTISPTSSNEPVEFRRSQPTNIYSNSMSINHHHQPHSHTQSIQSPVQSQQSKDIPLTNRPPIHVDEFAEYLERLKAADNYKFSQEYEVKIIIIIIINSFEFLFS